MHEQIPIILFVGLRIFYFKELASHEIILAQKFLIVREKLFGCIFVVFFFTKSGIFLEVFNNISDLCLEFVFLLVGLLLWPFISKSVLVKVWVGEFLSVSRVRAQESLEQQFVFHDAFCSQAFCYLFVESFGLHRDPRSRKECVSNFVLSKSSPI